MSVNARRDRIPTPSGYAPLKSGWLAISHLEHVVVLERQKAPHPTSGEGPSGWLICRPGDYQVMVPEPDVNLTTWSPSTDDTV